ncbi:16315_t:CDS:2 [Gigaspora margarita]|uniref:16315_t:CDS:1 n=1 Tax=Gigaspora margarita TaxID=4874 RepID=A0ABN7UVZ2_GIGMA|nr:16315_t:CDS:2 [Gigaspora margarita]
MATKPFQCLLCNKLHTNKTSLVTHEQKFNYQNIIVPHYHILFTPLYSSYCHFHEQEAFTFQVSSYKYNCIFKGQVGVKQIGELFQCSNWWIKANNFGGETIVDYQQQDPITKKFIDKEISFSWKRKSRKMDMSLFIFIEL